MAKKLREEDLRLNIVINGDAAKNQLLDAETAFDNLGKKLSKAQSELGKIDKSLHPEKYKKADKSVQGLAAAYEKQKQRVESLQRQQKNETMTLNELQHHIKATTLALKNAVPGTDNWKKLNKELNEAKQRFKELSGQANVIKTIFKDLPSWQVILTGAERAYNLITSGTEKARQAWLDYDEAMTDAIKTTNLSREEMELLAADLKKIDTRTSTNDLLALTRAAGKLGVSGRENLLGFVRAADKINVALSEDLGGDAEAAITAIGKIADIFGLVSQYGYEDAMLKIGSAINELGMASTANEGYIVDFSKRLAGIAPNADISIDKVLGLAATLDKYGQAAETSATAIGQTITAMFRKTEAFANIAKVPLQEFKTLLQTDVNEALLRVLEGMKGSEGSLADITQAMDEMHLKGQRATTVLGALANNVEELRNQQQLSLQAFTDGSSLTEEFAVKNDTASARVEKLKNDMTDLSAELGQKLQPAYIASLQGAKGLMSTLVSLAGWVIKYRSAIILLTATIFAYVKQEQISIAVKKLAELWSRKNRIALQKETATMVAQIGTEKAASLATSALALAKALLTANIKAATLATKALWAAMKANPLGLILAALTAVVAALSAYRNKAKEAAGQEAQAAEKAKEFREELAKGATEIELEKQRLKELRDAALNAASGSDERKRAIDRINEAYKDYLPSLLTEKSSNNDIARSLDIVNQRMVEHMRLQLRMTHMEKAEEAFGEGVSELYNRALMHNSSINMRHYGANQTDADIFGRRQEGRNTYLDPIVLDIVSSIAAQARTSGTVYGGAMNALLDSLADKYKRKFRDSTTAIFALYKSIISGIPVFEDGTTDLDYGKSLKDLLADYNQSRNLVDAIFPMDFDVSGNNNADYTPPTGDDKKKKWSLSSDEKFLKAKAELQKKYLSGEIQTEEEYSKRLLQLEIDSLRARLDANKETGADREALEIQLGEKEMQLRRNLENVQKQDNEKKKQSALKEMSDAKRAYELRRLSFENEMNRQLALVKKGSQEEIELNKQKVAGLLRIDRDYLDEMKKLLEEIIETGTLSGVAIPTDELEAYKQRLQEIVRDLLQNQSDTKDAGKTEGRSYNGSLFGVNQAEWDQLFKNLADGKIGVDDLGSAFEAMGNLADKAFSLTTKALSLTAAKEKKALKEYEKSNETKKASLKDRFDAGLMTEQQYNAEVSAMEAELEAEREETEREQAEREKTSSIIQSIINTALSVGRAFVDWPWPASVGVASIVGALGAAETAMIAAQPVGYEEGGFLNVTRAQDGKRFRAKYDPNRRGFINGPTVITGESGREYVVPAEALANPSILPYINTIESARRAGRLKTLNMAVIRPSGIYSGLSSGGSISDTQPQDPIGSFGKLEEIFHELVRLMRLLDRRLESPIKAEVDYLGHGGIKESIEKDKAYRQRGKIK